MSSRCRSRRRTTTPMLPENLMLDVLSRLPAKSIMQCKCVCKKWRDLVSDPYFVQLHLLRSREALMITDDLSFRPPGTLKWVELIKHEVDYHLVPVKSLYLERCAPHEQYGSMRIDQCGSVNGLICCVLRHHHFYVFNPILEEYITLPVPSRRPHLREIFGFGVSKAGEYKVIRICGRRLVYLHPDTREDVYALEIDVYTLGTHQWRSVEQTQQTLYCLSIKSPGLCLNGHVYWVGDGQIYAFDLITETFELFPSPPAPRDKDQMLGVLKGNLSCICWSLSGLEVWVKKEESWYKEITIEEVVSPFLKSRVWRPLCLIDGLNGDSILLVYVEVTRKLMMYCLNTNTIRNLYLPAIFNNRVSYWNDCAIYRPSFVKLDNFRSKRAVVPFTTRKGGSRIM